MRILFYLHQYPAFGGIETVTTLLASQFNADGHKVGVVSFKSRSGTKLLAELPACTWRRLPSENILVEENYSAICRELQNFSPDVIIFQDSYCPIEDVLFRAVQSVCPQVPVVVVEHSMPRAPFPHQFGFGGIKDIVKDLALVVGAPYLYGKCFFSLRKRRRKLHLKSGSYVLLSRQYECAERLISGWCDRSRVCYIPNPIKHSSGRPVSYTKKRQILTVCSLIKLKGVDRLINIWAQVESQFPDWSFIIVGDGEERIHLKQQVELLRLRNVRFVGFAEDPTTYYQESSLFVMASSFEGWPMVLGEAMQQGCVPIVYNSFKSCTDIIEHRRSGIVVDCFNQKRFVTELKCLMENPLLLEEFRNFAIRRADKFRICNIVGLWYDLFRKLKIESINNFVI